ncbi:MAG TPA: sulfatase-like hydrolase/transferase [Bryobacteraceae bacterium]
MIRRFPKLGKGLLLSVLAAFPSSIFAAPSTSIVLISIDTLRADHLGCYGYRNIRTPHLDSLAKGGTLFEQIESPVPMTLPAHVSLLSSTYPYVHGVRENGEQVPPKILTLPAVLKADGYRTAAFIGGYVLDARFGMNNGFDVYDSPFHLRPDPGEEPPEVKRSADGVLNAAAQWIKTNSGHPFFAFIHLYDVHQPYSHGSYDGEISYVDEAIGRFQQSLAGQKVLGDAIVILTADHGESLGEHGEETHGYFIYQGTLRVPLVIHWPAGASKYAARVKGPASIIDLAPALLEFLGIPVPAQFQGHNLMRLLGPQPSANEPIYAESLYAHDHMGCSPLRTVRIGRYKFIEAPKPELYDLEADPGETQNRYGQDHDVALRLRARLASFQQSDRQSAQNPTNPEVISRLRSLGYLSGRASGGNSGADPKDRLQVYLRYGRAIRYANTGHLPEAIREFQAVLEDNNENTSARFYLAVCYYRSRSLEDAVKALNATLATSPDYPPAEELLGTIALIKEDFVGARQHFVHLAAIDPANFNAHYNLGILAMRDGRTEEALRELRQALAINPKDESARKTLDELQKKASN